MSAINYPLGPLELHRTSFLRSRVPESAITGDLLINGEAAILYGAESNAARNFTLALGAAAREGDLIGLLFGQAVAGVLRHQGGDPALLRRFENLYARLAARLRAKPRRPAPPPLSPKQYRAAFR